MVYHNKYPINPCPAEHDYILSENSVHVYLDQMALIRICTVFHAALESFTQP